MANPSNSSNSGRAAAKHGFQVVINASGAKVKEDLNARLKQYKELSAPELKTHLKRVRTTINNMPEIWQESPLAAQAGLKKFASELGANEKKAVEMVDAAIGLANENRAKAGKRVQVTVPTLVSWLNNGANHPHRAEDDFNERFEAFVSTIAKRQLTREQKKQRRLSLPVMLHPLPASETVAALPPAPPASASKGQRKAWQDQYSLRVKASPLEALPAECTANNPAFAVFAVYKQRARIFGQDCSNFDKLFQSRILAKLPPLKGLKPAQVSEALLDICRNQKSGKPIHFGALNADPYAMLSDKFTLKGDELRLIPLLLKMVIRVRQEIEAADSGLNSPRKTHAVEPYLGTDEFTQDCSQLQIALEQGKAKTANLVSTEDLNASLSPQKPKVRKRLEKQESGEGRGEKLKEEESGTPYKASSPRFARTTTTTTSNTTTTTTTAIEPSKKAPDESRVDDAKAAEIANETQTAMGKDLADIYRSVLGYAAKVQEGFGHHAVFGLFHAVDVLLQYKCAAKPGRMSDKLKAAFTAYGAPSQPQITALQDAHAELSRNVRALGTDDDARKLVEFLGLVVTAAAIPATKAKREKD